MKNNRNLIMLVIISTLIISLFSININAASGYQGYAIYRDGVALNLNWHAGLMDEAYSTDYLPVTQAPGGSSMVKWGSWDEFISGKTFKGVYRPKTAPSSTSRDNFVAMGRKLINEQIPYCLEQQMDYNKYDSNGKLITSKYWIYPEDITSIRCDGVVEFTYEYYGFKVWGPVIYGVDSYWDISRWDLGINNYHTIYYIQPKSQAQSYLTLITANKPVTGQR